MSLNFQYDSPLVYDSDVEYDAYSPSVIQAPTVVLAHLAASVALSPNGSFQFVQQGTIEEIAQSVEVICGTDIGDRPVVPTFGIPQQEFTQPSISQITTAINNWEPRAAVQVSVNTDQQTGVSNVKVAVTPANQTLGTLS